MNNDRIEAARRLRMNGAAYHVNGQSVPPGNVKPRPQSLTEAFGDTADEDPIDAKIRRFEADLDAQEAERKALSASAARTMADNHARGLHLDPHHAAKLMEEQKPVADPTGDLGTETAEIVDFSIPEPVVEHQVDEQVVEQADTTEEPLDRARDQAVEESSYPAVEPIVEDSNTIIDQVREIAQPDTIGGGALDQPAAADEPAAVDASSGRATP